jgi:hypothetical protein
VETLDKSSKNRAMISSGDFGTHGNRRAVSFGHEILAKRESSPEMCSMERFVPNGRARITEPPKFTVDETTQIC